MTTTAEQAFGADFISINSDSAVNRESGLFVIYLKQKRPPPAEIRRLHPKIVDVRVPRSKSAKFCILEFESPEAARAAKLDLNRNTEISVRLRRKENNPPPEKISKRKERKLKRKLEITARKAVNEESAEPPKKRGKMSTEVPATTETAAGNAPKTSNRQPEKITTKKGKVLKRKVEKVDKEESPKSPKKKVLKPFSKWLPGKSPATLKVPQSPKQKAADKKANKKQKSTESVETEDSQILGGLITDDPCSLLIKGLPLLASQQVLNSLFPKCTKIEISNRKINNRRCGVVQFASAEEAIAALESSSGVCVNGEALAVERCLKSSE